MNTSVIRPYDFDGDGDLDLFVGSRSYPGQYGLNPQNYLYENTGTGDFRDITKQIAPELYEAGMVRDAAWADLNGDGRKELIVVGDWVSPQVYRFDNRRLVKTETKLENLKGFLG